MKRNLQVWMIVILVFSLLLSACASAAPATQPETVKEPASSASLEVDRVLRMGVAGSPKIDPAVGTDAASCMSFVNIYDFLVNVKLDGSIEPSLAERWETSADSKEFTFFLRKGVKFHDGTELNADDVVFSAERLKTMGEGFAFIYKGLIDKVEKVDDYSVKFTLTRPVGAFVSTLVRLAVLNKDLVLQHLDMTGKYGEMGDYGRAWLLTNDAGSGPYMVTEFVQQSHMTATQFKDYWKGWSSDKTPTTIKLINSSEPATTRTMIQNRELEITDEYQSAENISAMLKIPGVSLGIYSSGGVQNMMYNNKRAPTDDVHFRRALNYMYDYAMVSKNVFVDSPQAIGPVSAGVPGASKDLNQFTQDLEKAKEELAKSKYAAELANYPVEFMINSTVPDQEKIALSLQATAETLGVKIEITKGPWLNIIEKVSSLESTPNILCITVSPSYFDAGSMLESRYTSKSLGSWEQGEWLQDAKLDEMIEDAIGTVDQAERYAKYDTISKYIVDEITPSGWLVDLVKRTVYQSDYVKWPAAELAKAGNITTLPLGFTLNFSQFEVYPEKINK